MHITFCMPGFIELNNSNQVFVKSVVDCGQECITATVFAHKMNVSALETYRAVNQHRLEERQKVNTEVV